jgi:hypothetical protein
MNQDQPRGKWSGIKRQVKADSEQLTDDDFRRADNSIEKLYDIIGEKMRDQNEVSQEQLDKSDEESRQEP